MTEPAVASGAGLFTREGTPVTTVPLTGVSMDAEISSFCARVVVKQRYVNRETRPIEAVYVFPLDEGAAVCGFEVVVDDTLVVGEVKEREKAYEIYDEAMQQGHGAFLLDEERPDVFQASVGNLPPGKEVLLKLTYVTELTADGSGLRFAIPTTVSPRYAPPQDQAGLGRPDSETLNPPVAWQVPYGLSLSVRLAMPDRITRVESPSHPIAVSVEGEKATVTLSQTAAALDRDFVLSIGTAGLDRPEAWIERDADGTTAVAVAFLPTLGQAVTPGEVIFVIDRSGSMQGTSILEVRNALQLCLRSMTPGCSFNIVGFGSSFEALFPESRAYDETSLAAANAHVASLNANLGGTEVLPALQFVLEHPRLSALARQVVVMTDGQVTNTDAVLALAAKHARDTRVFTFGIGAGASHHLVKGLARAGGGSAEFIYPGERIEPKVVRVFGRLLSPALTDLQIDWGGLDVTQAPAKVPPVFSGGRLLVYGFIRHLHRATATLKGTGPSGPFAFEVPLDPGRSAGGRAVATLAARARIRELEESPSWTESRGSRQGRKRETGVAQEIISLGVKYSLVSPETSFVAVERRDTPVIGDVQLRRIPVALTTGWGGLQDAVIGHAAKLGSAEVFDGAAFLLAPAQARLGAGWRALRDAVSFNRAERNLESGPLSPRAEQLEHWPVPAGLHALVALQRADGSWDLNSDLAAVLGRTLGPLEHEIAGAYGRDEEVRRAWATALAIAWLEANAPDSEPEWRMLVRKAHQWLDTVAATPANAGEWVEIARRFLALGS